MLVRRNKLVLLPAVLTLIAVGVLLIVVEVLPAAPFFYPLF